MPQEIKQDIENQESNEPNLPNLNKPEEPVFRQVWLFLFDIIKIVVLSLAIVLPVRFFLIQPFSVKGASMEPNYHDGEYLIVDEISYRFREPERGEVVVLHPKLQSDFYIKRIIGLPRETIDIENGQVKISNAEHPDGFILKEPYLEESLITSGFFHRVLESGEYFVMGDNRSASLDSRAIGPIPKKNIVGRAWIRAWPVNRTTIFSSPLYQYNFNNANINP
ncbi:MAG TPA: signal peptidase I [Patescibacteria group bacterium]|nr:signal peptidase I [Patescibacteria group bacterium]